VPTYEYACTACAERLEAVQSFADAPLTECPACGGLLRKVFSPVGVVFKGSGFYKTDSRKPSSSSNGSGSKPDAKPEPKTESKPAETSTSSTSSTSTDSSSSTAKPSSTGSGTAAAG
jgi:putative FmdB family regulatory protein